MKIKELLKQPEGRRLEFKEKLPAKADLCKTIIAFANDAGGILYIGIKDSPREIAGLPEDDIIQTEEQISNLVFDNCYPIIIPEISILNINDKLILKVQIYSGSNMPYYLKQKGKTKGTYIRIGSSNRLASEEIIIELERQKRNISFDSELILEFDYKTLNLDRLNSLYHEKTGTLCDEMSLKKLKVLKEYNGELKLTNGLLLFSDDHHKSDYFPYAKIECARFKGTSVDIFIDRKTYDGNILDQVELAYEFVLRHINQSAVTEGVYTKTSWQYPIKAIREVIRNAVIHRDYSLTGKDIKLAVYDDMVEITSPGRLLPSVDYNNMEVRQSEIRNKVLAPFFRHLGLIDQWGNGLKLISDELKKFPDVKLNWSEVGLQFQVQFILTNYLAEAKGLVEGLVESQQSILRLVEKNPTISKKEMTKTIGISTTALDKNIENLKKKGLLQRVGPPKSGHWQIEKNIKTEGLVGGLVEGLVGELVEGLVESQQSILRLVEKNPKISKKEMAKTIGISTTALDKNIETLKKKGLLQRVGSAKSGQWQIFF